jgi:DUF4097 and DUF4098 domain-containing protein YvlB
MKHTMLGLLAAAAWYAAAPAWPAAGGGTQQDERWNWSGRVAAGKTLEIRGINGTIEATAATGDRAEIAAVKRGRDDDPRDVRIEVVEHDGGVTICAVYPGRDNRCAPGGGRMSVRDNDVEVDFTVRVPRGVLLSAHNVNGGIEVTDLAAPAHLRTVNGGIRVVTNGGDADAQTVNGGITAEVRSIGQQPLRFKTVNGSITVALPADLNVDFEAKTVNGGIESDFPITVQGRMTPRELRGRIGGGGRMLELETVNGSVRLRRL